MTVQQARRARGWTQEQLVTESGVKLSTLQKIERARTMPPGTRVDVALRLARALGVTIEDFFEE